MDTQFDNIDFSNYETVPLYTQFNPVCATDPHFVLPVPKTFRLPEHVFAIFGDDMSIRCADTDVEYFTCHAKRFSLRDKKILKDNSGVPILNFKEKIVTFTNQFNIYTGENSDHKICHLECNVPIITSKMSTTFKDAVTGEIKRVIMKCNWSNKCGVVYLEKENNQDKIPIAKIYKKETGNGWVFRFGVDDYFLEVAPGVDIALMVTMCIAMEEHVRESRQH